MLTGDFRILADTLCAIRETGKIPGGTRTIRHVDELLATLAAVTHREYCIDLPDDQKRQGDPNMTMDDVLTKWEQGLRAEGYANGEKAGQNCSTVHTCQDLGKTEDETIHYLMKKYGMTRDEARSTTTQYWQS